MSKFLIAEQPAEEKSIFYNFGVIEADDEEEAEAKYLKNIDVDQKNTDLDIFNLDEIDTDFYYYLEVDMGKVKGL
ncbi:hypothetical protein AKJ49_00940 [candidate division MSBL1 archaeon SCGC-AAA382A03]|uniref:Uncharacterized protein n=1 Tax=candidate division MSBL1 archaeon SCGC-AAA382A03 TaxID=1698278 RepID=A0A133VG15_9EURY|nr:hypothetical protein AKJ49_00940 [candidate division MSBL1 archaeon SCGC-AAA382A03]